MLSKPEWVELLTLDLQPGEKQVNQLEKLRLDFDIPHEAFYWRIMSSPATTRKVQRNCLEMFRIQNPSASEKELLRRVLVSRLKSPPEIEVTEKEIDQAIKDINSFDELCDYIIKLEEKEPAFPDPFGIGQRIDEILAQE